MTYRSRENCEKGRGDGEKNYFTISVFIKKKDFPFHSMELGTKSLKIRYRQRKETKV